MFWLYIVQSIKELLRFIILITQLRFAFAVLRLLSKRIAKIWQDFHSTKYFEKNFQNIFKTVKLKPYQTVKAFVVLTTLGRKAGAKVETFLIPSKYFRNFFK